MLPFTPVKDMKLSREFYQAVCQCKLGTLNQIKPLLTDEVDLLYQDPVIRLNLLHIVIYKEDVELFSWLHEQLKELAGYLWQKQAYVKHYVNKEVHENCMTPLMLAETTLEYKSYQYKSALGIKTPSSSPNHKKRVRETREQFREREASGKKFTELARKLSTQATTSNSWYKHPFIQDIVVNAFRQANIEEIAKLIKNCPIDFVLSNSHINEISDVLKKYRQNLLSLPEINQQESLDQWFKEIEENPLIINTYLKEAGVIPYAHIDISAVASNVYSVSGFHLCHLFPNQKREQQRKEAKDAFFNIAKQTIQQTMKKCAELLNTLEEYLLEFSNLSTNRSNISPIKIVSPKQTISNDQQQYIGNDLNIAIAHQQLKYVNELARGGFGIVYKGVYQYADVAIKKLIQQKFDENSLTEFNREIGIMVNLRSPYIVQMYGACFEAPNYAIVMEYMAGGSLFNLLHDVNTILEWDVKCSYGLDIAKGMAYIHSRKVVHCDLKSLNILMDSTKKVAKIADFGLSKIKATSSLLFSTVTGGSIPWMAPELAQFDVKYDKPADVYSFAIVLWEIASRKMPYQSHNINPVLLLQWVAQGNRETIPTQIPPSMAKLIQRCWEQRAEQRPTMDQCVTELENIVNNTMKK